MEALEDRTLPSASSLPIVTVASPPAVPQVAALTAFVDSLMEQRLQLIATVVQDASNIWNTLDHEIVQEAAFIQQQVGRIFGINPVNPNQASHPAVSQASGAGQAHASGSGSGSGAMTTAHDDPHPRLEKAVPLTDSGSGSGSAPSGYSGSATVYGPVWLDNNADGSQDQANEEMDYSGATVDLLRSTDNGAHWSIIDSTLTSGTKYGNNYSLQAGFPVPIPSGWLYKVLVVFPSYCAATIPSVQSDIDTQGYSQVFSLAPGAMQFIPAGLVSMNVNTLADDPNGPTQQNAVTLRDAMEAGNNLKPFPAVTFYKTPNTPLTGQINIQGAELPSIEEPYNIVGPGPNSLTVSGQQTYRVFLNWSTSTISGLLIWAGQPLKGGADGGGIFNDGNLTLNNDYIENCITSGVGGAIANDGTLNLQQDFIYDNTCQKGGGGVYNSEGTVKIGQGVTINSNKSYNGGAGILNGGGTVSASKPVDIDYNINYGASGGGVNNGGKFQLLDGGSISFNQSAGNGGGAYNIGGTMTLQGVNVEGNTSLTSGGGIYVQGGTVTLMAMTRIFNKNKANEGGGMFVNGGTAKMSAGTIASNTALFTGRTVGGGFSNGGGGGLYVGGGSVTLTDLSIYDNTSKRDGGGVFNSAKGTLTLNYKITIDSNNTNWQGGGMYLDANSLTTFNGATVSGNTAGNAGNGIYQQNGAKVLPNPPNLTDNDDPGGKPVQGP